MHFSVPEDILQQARDCPSGFSCLDTGVCGEESCCGVEYVNGDNVLFLRSQEYRTCPFRMSFGERVVCRCPVRYYLIKRGMMH